MRLQKTRLGSSRKTEDMKYVHVSREKSLEARFGKIKRTGQLGEWIQTNRLNKEVTKGRARKIELAYSICLE